MVSWTYNSKYIVGFFLRKRIAKSNQIKQIKTEFRAQKVTKRNVINFMFHEIVVTNL